MLCCAAGLREVAAVTGYILAVTRTPRPGFKTAADWPENVPSGAWPRLRAGARGPWLHDWAWLPYRRLDTACGWRKGLLIRRKLAPPEAFAFY